jgi:DNA polymerase-3 subunit gamma/tau
MSYLVIARKWRPQSFEELVGQEHVSRTLANAIRSERVAHAFLFTGVRGVGKTTAARILAKALNCIKGPTPTPCNQCVNCEEITAGSAVDVLEIDGASNTGVDDVREIIENVRYRPAKSRFKIYIIDEVHMLSTSAFNALLKTLEEPPAHVKFIFATTDPHKVPQTIHSRCQRYDFKRIPPQLVAERLGKIATSEGITMSERALFTIAREGEGSMRDAQSLLDQVIAFAGATVADDDVSAALGVADRAQLYAIAEAVLDRQPRKALALLDTLYGAGQDLRRFSRELLEHFRNLAVARMLPEEPLLADLSAEERADCVRQAEKWSSEDLDRAFRLLLATENEVARVSYPKLVLEMTLIKVATMPALLPVEVLLDRLDDLERRLTGSSGNRSPGPSPRLVAARAPAAARDEPPGRTAPAASQSGPTGAIVRPGTVEPATSPASGRTWEAFLECVAKEKVTLLPYLQKSAPPPLDGKDLVLAVPSGYYYDYLAQRDHARLVEELAQRFFGQPYRVRVQIAETATTSAEPAAEVSNADLHATALGHPVVRAAVEILGGEVREVRARTRREKGSE